MNYEQRLLELGYSLPVVPPRGGVYAPAKKFCDGLMYVSGCGPAICDKNYQGKLGAEISFEDGQKAAVNCILNVLSVIKAAVGDLNNIKSIAKVTVFVASADDFYMQPQVANAATQLLEDVFGEEIGCPSRSAIGVNVLPGNIAVEIEALIEVAKL